MYFWCVRLTFNTFLLISKNKQQLIFHHQVQTPSIVQLVLIYTHKCVFASIHECKTCKEYSYEKYIFTIMTYLINRCFISGLLRKVFLGTSPLPRFRGFKSEYVTLLILFSAKFYIVKNNSLILEWLQSREGWQNRVLQNPNPANFDAPNLF